MKSVAKILLLVTLLLIIPTVSAEQFADMQVTLLSYEPTPVQPGQTMDVFLQISSSGKPTTDAWLELVEEYPFTILETQDSKRAQNLGVVSGVQTLQFRIRIAENAKDGLTPLRVQFSESQTDRGFEEIVFDINIDTFDAKIGIEEITQTPKRLTPGEEGTLEITFRNFDDTPLKNIDVHLDFTDSYDMSTNMNNILSVQAMINARLEEVNRRVASGLSPIAGATPMMSSGANMERVKTTFAAVAPVGADTQIRIPTLEGGETYTAKIPIQALPDASPDIYALPIYVNYNDEDNNPFHTRVEIPLLVDDDPQLYVELKESSLRTTDFGGTVTFVVANRGLSPLRSVTIDLEGDETIRLLMAPESIYIGDLAPSEAKEAVFNIIPESKNITLPLKLQYRDSFNKERTKNKQIDYFIINRNYYRDMPFEMMLVWIILGIVILLLTIFFVNHLKKKRS